MTTNSPQTEKPLTLTDRERAILAIATALSKPFAVQHSGWPSDSFACGLGARADIPDWIRAALAPSAAGTGSADTDCSLRGHAWRGPLIGKWTCVLCGERVNNASTPEITALEQRLDAERARADKAEAQVAELQSKLADPARPVRLFKDGEALWVNRIAWNEAIAERDAARTALAAVREMLLGKDATDGGESPGDWGGYKSWSEIAIDYTEEIKARKKAESALAAAIAENGRLKAEVEARGTETHAAKLIRQERDRQRLKWGTAHDWQHNAQDWNHLLGIRMGKLADAMLECREGEARHRFVQVAAVAQAAVEVLATRPDAGAGKGVG